MRTFGPAYWSGSVTRLRPLLVHSARYAALAIAVVWAVAAGAAAVRLLPWLVAPEIPLAVAAPFAERLLGVAGDVAIMIGLHVGVVAATADFVDTGQSRALFALGASPMRLAAGIVPVGLVAVGVGLAADSAWSSSHDAEGSAHFAARLIEAGRAACAGARGRRIDVPIVGVSWLCFAESPRLVGKVRALGSDIVFSASDVAPFGDLSFRFLDARVAGTSPGSRQAFRARARFARVTGLVDPGSSGSRLTGSQRSVVLSGSGALLGLAVAWHVLRRSFSNPIDAGCITGAAAVAMLLAVHALDRRVLPAWSYLAVPGVGVAAGFCLLRAREAYGRFFGARVARRVAE